MEMRFLGRSGLRVSVLSLGTMTFGGKGPFFAGVGAVDVEEATRMVDICLDRGVNLIDTADVYSDGLSEQFLGKALLGKRDSVLIATKVHGRTGDGSNDVGGSRHHIVRACEASLRRLDTDYIDLYQLHGFDANTPIEETISALDMLVRAGKVRYIGCSNFSAWQLMKALAISERTNREPFISQQVFYSLVARELEFELVPIASDRGIGILVWSPLAGGFLSGKYQRGQAAPVGSRGEAIGLDGVLDIEAGYAIIAELEVIARRHDGTTAQAALNWLRSKPYVSSIILGARHIEQLTSTLDCLEWSLSADEEWRLDEVSAPVVPYPYWHQQKYNAERGTTDSRV
jgi:aryl-alcohol dehydrogenase-like predicted oxidoreductase